MKKAFKLIRNKNHPRGFLSGVYNACCSRVLLNKQPSVEDPRQQHSGIVLLFNNGFRLIELLVVVLIIGILAAIALPQYQVAVAKTKYATLKLRVHAVLNAVQAYHEANNEWPATIHDLDITLPGREVGDKVYLSDEICRLWYDGKGKGGAALCDSDGLSYYVEFQNGSTRSCRVKESNTNAKAYMQVCLNETQNTSPDSKNGTSIYNYSN